MKGRHPVAFWAATAAALGSLAAVEAAHLLTDAHVFQQALGALITAAVVGGSVYAHERLREEREQEPTTADRKVRYNPAMRETPQPGAPPDEPTPEPEPTPGNGDGEKD